MLSCNDIDPVQVVDNYHPDVLKDLSNFLFEIKAGNADHVYDRLMKKYNTDEIGLMTWLTTVRKLHLQSVRDEITKRSGERS